jgi:hypothetical protein
MFWYREHNILCTGILYYMIFYVKHVIFHANLGRYKILGCEKIDAPEKSA